MIGRIKGFFSSVLPVGVLGQGSQEVEGRGRPRLFEETDRYTRFEETGKWGIGLLRKRREEITDWLRRFGVRRRVRRGLSDFYDIPQIVDEVTEKVYETSKEDHRLRSRLLY